MSLTYSLNICPVCLFCTTCAKSRDICICEPQEFYKRSSSKCKLGFFRKPITKYGYTKYKKAIDYDFLAWFKANVPAILKVPEGLDYANICKNCINKYEGIK